MKTALWAWIFFLTMAFLVAVVIPLGEGFDEPWHLGYVQYVAESHRLPPGPQLHLSTDLEGFLEEQPVGWRLYQIYTGLHSHDEYWRHPEAARHSDESIRRLRFSDSYRESRADFSRQYESHQAPLFYVLTAPLFIAFARFLNLPDTFLMIRLWSVLLSSAVVPLAYKLARRVSQSRRVAAAVAVLVATFPGIYPDIVRVSNDALLVPLMAATLLALSRSIETRERGDAAILGVILLAGLWTKAFFIPVVAATALALLALHESRAFLTVAAASTLGWIAYVRNLQITGSVTGLPETVSANTTILSSLASAASINWTGVLKLAAASHIFMGYWSLLTYRSWIYEAILFFFAVGMIGFFIYLRRTRASSIAPMLFVYASFAASLVYYATQVYQSSGLSVIQGWYLSPFIPFETLAFVLGIQNLFSRKAFNKCVAAMALMFIALMLYGTCFIAAPYYSGLIDHAPSGHLRAYHPHWADIAVMNQRVTRLHPWMPAVTPAVFAVGALLVGFFLMRSFLREPAS